jgi:hypothetical protein
LFFGFSRRDVADRFEQAAVVELVQPFECGILDGLKGSPRPSAVDHLRLVKAVDCLSQSIVIAVADAADRRFDPRLSEGFRVSDGDILGKR